MKIASYNIISGGFDSYEYESPKPQRLPEIQKAIETIDADVIGLIDTFRWDTLYKQEDIKSLFGYDYSVIINLNDARLREKGHNNGLALLSRIPISEGRPISLESRDALQVKFHDQYDKETHIYVVYLDDLNEDTRVSQINTLLASVDLNERVIIMGDFNTFASEDVNEVEGHLEVFYSSNPSMRNALQPIVDGMAQSKVTRALGAFGLNDAGSKRRQPTFPTNAFPAKTSGPFLRLDYCFHSPSIKVDNLKVESGEVFDEASDHLAISFGIK